MDVYQKFSNPRANIFTLQEERDRERERQADRLISDNVEVLVSPKYAGQHGGTLENS